jgi:hypothetical protein
LRVGLEGAAVVRRRASMIEVDAFGTGWNSSLERKKGGTAIGGLMMIALLIVDALSISALVSARATHDSFTMCEGGLGPLVR